MKYDTAKEDNLIMEKEPFAQKADIKESGSSVPFRKGQKVRLMDSNDEATVLYIKKGRLVLLVDGMQIEVPEKEAIPIDEVLEKRLRASGVLKTVKETESADRHANTSNEVRVDLHIEKLPGGSAVPPVRALEYQLAAFHQVLRQNLRHRGCRITFIHGVGDSILSSAIRRELDQRYATTCSYTIGQPGVTKVTVR